MAVVIIARSPTSLVNEGGRERERENEKKETKERKERNGRGREEKIHLPEILFMFILSFAHFTSPNSHFLHHIHTETCWPQNNTGD